VGFVDRGVDVGAVFHMRHTPFPARVAVQAKDCNSMSPAARADLIHVLTSHVGEYESEGATGRLARPSPPDRWLDRPPL
jgi:hypothetical protein